MQLFKKSQAVMFYAAIGIATFISCNNTSRQHHLPEYPATHFFAKEDDGLFAIFKENVAFKL